MVKLLNFRLRQQDDYEGDVSPTAQLSLFSCSSSISHTVEATSSKQEKHKKKNSVRKKR